MSLQFNVLTLLREPVGSVRHQAVAGDVLVDGTRQHVSGDTTFLRTQDGVLVTGDLAGERQDVCSRCLRDVTSLINVEVRDEYVATVALVRVPLETLDARYFRDTSHSRTLHSPTGTPSRVLTCRG